MDEGSKRWQGIRFVKKYFSIFIPIFDILADFPVTDIHTPLLLIYNYNNALYFCGFFYYSLTYKAQFSDFGNFSLISRLWFPWKYSRHQIISIPRAFDRDSQAVVAACKYFKLFTNIKEKQFQAHGISGNYISLTSLRNSSMSDGICHWARPPWTWVTKKSSGIEWRRHTCLFLLDTKPLWYWGRWKSVPASKRDHWPRHRHLASVHYADLKPLVNFYIQQLVQIKWGVAVHGRHISPVKPTLGQPKKFQYFTRSEKVITRLRICHPKGNKSHIFSRGPLIICHHCGQTLSIDHMLLQCAVLQESHNEYYRADSLSTISETIPDSCTDEFLREAGFFYLIWMVRHSIRFSSRIISELM